MKDIKQINKNKETRLGSKALLKYSDNIKPKDLAEILHKLFYVRMDGGKEKTFSSTTGRLSGNFHSRSIEDAFRVSRNYIPNITYQEVYDACHKAKDNGGILGSFCYTCRRTVYRSRSLKQEEQHFRDLIRDNNILIKDNQQG